LQSYDLQTYTNTEVIAIDQDPLGIQGQVIWENCPSTTLEDLMAHPVTNYEDIPACQQIWARPLADGSWGVAFVNYDSNNNSTVTCDQGCFGSMNLTSATVRDLWAHETLGQFTTFSAEVDVNGGSRTFRFIPA
jgi:hypothetical protein